MEVTTGSNAIDGIHLNKLHPTFGAEVEGVDFANVSDSDFQQIRSGLAKV